ncbi:MAG TPA: hypothetical protein ENH20_01050 [Candidatus Pacearchaeota archaeon]|nr:hypothetical protein [Candidatus Pacearchaeota archaeon]
MIKESRPLSMAEVVKLVGDSDKSEAIKKFIGGFDILDFEKVKKLGEELEALDIIKLKDRDIMKIVDFVPIDAGELNKVIVEVSLDADEVNKILEVTKKYK